MTETKTLLAISSHLGISCFEHLNFGHSRLFRISDFDIRIS